MTDFKGHSGSWNVIARRVREREHRRQVVYNNLRKTARNRLQAFAAGRVPEIVLEFFKMMMGALLGFWLIGKLLAFLFHANSLYLFAVFGIAYSLQATYYKYRLARDPGFKIPRCKCAGRRNDSPEAVLRSQQSTILGVPNSVLSGLCCSAVVVLCFSRHPDGALLIAAAAAVFSGYLSFVMVARIGSLCVNCINVSALNLLILFNLLR